MEAIRTCAPLIGGIIAIAVGVLAGLDTSVAIGVAAGVGGVIYIFTRTMGDRQSPQADHHLPRGHAEDDPSSE